MAQVIVARAVIAGSRLTLYGDDATGRLVRITGTAPDGSRSIRLRVFAPGSAAIDFERTLRLPADAFDIAIPGGQQRPYTMRTVTSVTSVEYDVLDQPRYDVVAL